MADIGHNNKCDENNLSSTIITLCLGIFYYYFELDLEKDEGHNADFVSQKNLN